MRQITFSLPKKEIEEGQPPQEGLHFITYMMKRIHLMPGEEQTVTIRDVATGWYEDWSDQDIKDFYEERYKQYGLEVTVSQGKNYP